jgi:hypothetical protein
VVPDEPQAAGRAELEHRVRTRARMIASPYPAGPGRTRRPPHSYGPRLRSCSMRR